MDLLLEISLQIDIAKRWTILRLVVVVVVVVERERQLLDGCG